MKNIITALLSLFLITSSAQAYSPPEHKGWITDTTNKLTAEQDTALEAKVAEFNKKTSAEIAVLVIPTLGDESISEIANDTGNTWGVGDKDKKNGVLLVIALKERKSRIEVGAGVEGELTDSESSDILHNILPLYLRKGDFYGGINAVIDNIESELTKDVVAEAPVATTTQADSTEGWVFLGIVCVFFVGFIIAITFSLLSERKRAREREARMRKFDDEMRELRNKTSRYTFPDPPAPRAPKAPATPKAPVAPRVSTTPKTNYSEPVFIPVIETPTYEAPKPSYESPNYDPPSYDSGGGSDFGGGSFDGGGSDGGW